MEHFWDTVDTIGEGFGFSLFGARHLVTLALYIGFAALSCKLYKAADGKKRAAGALCRSPARGRGVQTDRFADRREFQLGLSAAAPVLDQHFPYRAVRMEAEQAARQFSLFYLYPRGDGGTAVPDVDVASGGELHVLAFDERAHSACGLSHHAVFGR